MRIAVAHANRPESGQRLHELLVENVPNLVSSYVTELGAVVSAHAGPGALLAAAIRHCLCARPLRPGPPEAAGYSRMPTPLRISTAQTPNRTNMNTPIMTKAVFRSTSVVPIMP